MAGKPGGSAPGGVPTFWAPAGITADATSDVTVQTRAPFYTPRIVAYFNYGQKFVDFLVATPPAVADTDHILRAPTYTPRWQPWRIDTRYWIAGTPQTLKPIAGGGPGGPGTGGPFGLDDWPNPRWPSYRNYSWTDYLTVQIIPPEGNQRDWPNPRGPQWPVSLRTWLGGRISIVTVSGDGTGAAAGVGAANATGAATAAATGAADGIGSALAISDAGTSTGSASGVGTATAVGGTTEPICLLEFEDSTDNLILEDGTGFLQIESCQSIGNAAGVGTANGVGAATAANQGAADGLGDAVAVGTDATVAAIGNAAGIGDANGVGFAIGVVEATGTADGLGGANGVSEGAAEILPPGGRGVRVHRWTRARWRELQLLIAAEKAARAKAERLTTPAKKRPLLAEADAAQLAIVAAQIEGENKRLDRELVRNAEAIRASIRAATQVKLLKESAEAIAISRQIAARQAENEEDEMIRLLLLS